MSVLRWLVRRWYIPVLILVGVLGFVAGARRRCPSPLDLARSELDAVDAGEKIRLIELKRGTDEANAAADLKYREAINALDERHKARAEKLRRDPSARARFLERVSRRRPGDPI